MQTWVWTQTYKLASGKNDPREAVFASQSRRWLHRGRASPTLLAGGFVSDEFVDSRKTHENVDDLRQHRIHPANECADVPTEKPEKEPVKTSDDEEDERHHV